MKEENKAKSVPLLIYENEMKHKTNIIKWLFIVLFTVIVLFGISTFLFIRFISSYDRVSYNQDGKGVNNVNTGNQGDIINESTIKN